MPKNKLSTNVNLFGNIGSQLTIKSNMYNATENNIGADNISNHLNKPSILKQNNMMKLKTLMWLKVYCHFFVHLALLEVPVPLF